MGAAVPLVALAAGQYLIGKREKREARKEAAYQAEEQRQFLAKQEEARSALIQRSFDQNKDRQGPRVKLGARRSAMIKGGTSPLQIPLGGLGGQASKGPVNIG